MITVLSHIYSSWHIMCMYSNGFHVLRAKFCRCQGIPKDHQLLLAGLYPASQTAPRTVFTFDVLRHFAMENVECKTAAKSFYENLRRLTSRSFPHVLPVGLPNLPNLGFPVHNLFVSGSISGVLESLQAMDESFSAHGERSRVRGSYRDFPWRIGQLLRRLPTTWNQSTSKMER